MPKVLLIEDEESLRNFYTKILTMRNYEVESAADREIALSLLKQFRPDVIVLDIVMPHYNGVEILKILKNDGDLKVIPVVMLTALSEMRRITECLDMGAIGYITKDSTVEEIVHRLNFLIESIGVH